MDDEAYRQAAIELQMGLHSAADAIQLRADMRAYANEYGSPEQRMIDADEKSRNTPRLTTRAERKWLQGFKRC